MNILTSIKALAPKLMYLPWAKVTRCEWHRVGDRKRQGVRIAGGWWVMFGPLKSLFG